MQDYRAQSQGGVAAALSAQGTAPITPGAPIPASWNIGTFHHGNPIYMHSKAQPDGNAAASLAYHAFQVRT